MLEKVLENSCKHKHFYKKSQNSKTYSIKDFTSSNSSSLYIIDTCVLLNPQNVFSQISEKIQTPNSAIEHNLPQIIKSIYGQTKYLLELKTQNKLITTTQIIQEFNDNFQNFNKHYQTLEQTLNKTQIQSEQITHFMKQIYSNMEQISENLDEIEFQNPELITDMISQYKTTKFHTKRLNFPSTKNHKTRNKKISDEDLSLIMLSSHLKTQTPDKNINIITGDRVLLGQGPVIYNNELYKSGKILISQFYKKFGTMFQYEFVEYSQPRLNPHKLKGITKKVF